MKSRLLAALAITCLCTSAQGQALTAETLTGWCQDARATFSGIVGSEPLLRTDQRRANATACAAYLRGWLEHEANARAATPQAVQCTNMPKDNAEMIGAFLAVAESGGAQSDLGGMMNNFGGRYCPQVAAAAMTQIQPQILLPTAPLPQAQIGLLRPVMQSAAPPQTTIAPQITAEAPKPQIDVTQYVIIPRDKTPAGNTRITEVGNALVQVPLPPETMVAEIAPQTLAPTPAAQVADSLPAIPPAESFAPLPQVNIAATAPTPKTLVSDIAPPQPIAPIAQAEMPAPQPQTTVANIVAAPSPEKTTIAVLPIQQPAPQPRAEVKTAERMETPPLAVDLSQYPLKPENELPEIKTAAVQPPPMQMPQPASVKALAEPAPLPVAQAAPKLTPPTLTPEQETSKLIASLAEPTAKTEIKATKPITTPMELKSPVVSNEPPPLLISSKQLRKLEKHEQAKIQIIQ